MTHEPRYREEEVREIFERAATHAESRALASPDGLTLAELQAIGAEVGLAPERIAEAAAALELRRGAQPRGTALGLPVSVGRVVELPRAPTDVEWERLVAELRQTFRARGKERSSGNLRQWTNGRLHAYIEPSGPDGYRLRMGTTKSDGTTSVVMGAGALAFALVLMLILTLGGGADDLVGPLAIALGGGALLGTNALRLPAWAAEREAQMEHMAGRARALIGAPESARPVDIPAADE